MQGCNYELQLVATVANCRQLFDNISPVSLALISCDELSLCWSLSTTQQHRGLARSLSEVSYGAFVALLHYVFLRKGRIDQKRRPTLVRSTDQAHLLTHIA